MIYYIIQVDTDSHNESVISTHDNSERAIFYMENYRAIAPKGIEYRIDTVPGPEEVKAANTRIKAELNRQFGKAKMDHEEGYPDTDSLRTKDFTIEELFPQDAAVAYTLTCTECACEVKK